MFIHFIYMSVYFFIYDIHHFCTPLRSLIWVLLFQSPSFDFCCRVFYSHENVNNVSLIHSFLECDFELRKNLSRYANKIACWYNVPKCIRTSTDQPVLSGVRFQQLVGGQPQGIIAHNLPIAPLIANWSLRLCELRPALSRGLLSAPPYSSKVWWVVSRPTLSRMMWAKNFFFNFDFLGERLVLEESMP